MTNLPYQNFEAAEFIENIKKQDKINKMQYGGFYSINIEEFELLVKLLSQEKSQSMAYYLEGYRKLQKKEGLSFKSYMIRVRKEHFDGRDNESNPITQLGLEAARWVQNRTSTQELLLF